MSKAILVMDMPKDCGDCHFCDDRINGAWCTATEGEARTIKDYGLRLADCPLIPAIGYVEPVGNMISWEDENDVD